MSADDVTTVLAALRGAERGGSAESLTAMLKQVLPANGDGGVAELAKEIAELKTVSQRQADAVAENTDAVAQNTTAKATGGESALATAGKSARNILSAGFGLAPLFTGLFHLFGGGGSEPREVVYPKAVRPDSIRAESYYSEAGDADASGMGDNDPLWPGVAGSRGASQRRAPAQITIQVQALDSRSFLDHRDEIARAVRSAMLNSNSLNDVVSEL